MQVLPGHTGSAKGDMMRASHVKGRRRMSPWSEGDLQLDDVRIHYYRTGAREKPPLVLLHGFSDNGLCWSEVVQDWEGDFDIIVPDARGHGLSSDSASGNYRRRAMAEDVAALIQALGLGPVRLGGHSMGAGVAAVVASEWPEVVRAVLLEDGALFVPHEPPTRSPEERQRRWNWLVEVRAQSLRNARPPVRRIPAGRRSPSSGGLSPSSSSMQPCSPSARRRLWANARPWMSWPPSAVPCCW
jgi:pimeloyl-ACP methyl ester carboxylesterase